MALITHHNVIEQANNRRAGLRRINFASQKAGEALAMKLGFTEESLTDREGSSKDGAITTSDLRDWV